LSRSRDLTAPAYSRVEGLYDVRRWLIRLLFSEAWLFAALAGTLSWPRLATTDRALLVISAACIVVGWVLSRRDVGLWIITAAPLCLILAAALNNPELDVARWVAIAVSTGHVAYGAVLLTGPRTGIVAIVLSCAALMMIWTRRPGNVVPGSLEVAGGWISVLSLAMSAGVLWWVWHELLRQARDDDERMHQVSERLQAELAVQERSRLWRATVVAVHERLLSTLRYLLQTDRLDRAGLRQLVDTHASAPGIAAPSSLAEDVREATAARIAAGIVRVDDSVLDLPLGDETRSAARAAIVECALNAVLHGNATDVHVSGVTTGDRCEIRVSDNGTGIDPQARPGLGWTTTLDEGLANVGGTWTTERLLGRTVVTLNIPALSHPDRASFGDDGFQQGRILIASPLVAVGLVGTAFSLIVGVNAARGWPLIIVAILASLGAAILVARRSRPSLIWSSLVMVGLAAIPWLMAAAVPSTTVSPAVIAGVTTAGYALIAVGVWSRAWQWVIGLLLWAAGVLVDARVGLQAGQDSLPIIVALVNCLIIVPVVVVVASIGSRRFQRSQAALALEREAVNRELIRANSATVIDQHLSACVAQADGIIAELADGADLDASRRHQVACLEGLIRATIQVDPVDAGEFSRVAARLVNAAFSVSVPAQVGTLVSSADPTPLDAELVRDLEALIADSGSVTVRTFTDGVSDYLSLEVHRTHAGGGPSIDILRSADPAYMDVEVNEEADGSVIVLLSRRIGSLV